MHFFGLGHRGTEKAVVPDATVHTVCPAGFCCSFMGSFGVTVPGCLLFRQQGDSIQSIVSKRMRGHNSCIMTPLLTTFLMGTLSMDA